uniref:Secreted protein n=1 Tax=Rhodosorus marinus TaxID=101924 RepID=A0A7S3EDB1_9RHOD
MRQPSVRPFTCLVFFFAPMAFVNPSFMGTPLGMKGAVCSAAPTKNVARNVSTMLVSDIGSKAELDKVLEGAGSSLVGWGWKGTCSALFRQCFLRVTLAELSWFVVGGGGLFYELVWAM